MRLRRDTDRAHGPDCAYSRWRNGADGLERRPLVGTAARRAAGGSSPPDFTGRGYGAPNCAGGLPFQCTDHAERWGFRRDQTTWERRVRPAARRRRAVPAGGRRSKPSPPSSVPRSTPRRELSRRSGFVPPPACGGLCRPEAGVPSRPRRLPYRGPRRDGSYPGGRGSSRRPPTAGCAGLKTGVPSRPRAPAPSAMRGFRCHRSPALLRATRPPSNHRPGGRTRCAPVRCLRRSRTPRTADRGRCSPRRPRR